MKRILIILLMIFAVQIGIAQETNCADKESKLAQYLSESEYAKAIEVWNDIKMTCITSSEKAFQLGLQLQQYKIEIASKEDKEKEVREILGLFKLYDKTFPNNANGNFEKSAMAMYLNKVGTNNEIYSLLDQAFEQQKKSFQNPEAIFVYFELYFEKYKSEKSTTTVEKLFSKYTSVTSLLEMNSEVVPANAEIYDRVLLGMESLMKDFLVCENIVSHAKNNFQTKMTDVYWLQAVAKMLSVSCKNAPVFESVAAELNNKKPSSKSTYYLATYYLNTAKQDKAIEYYTESVKLEKDAVTKANTAYTIASILSTTDKEKSKEMVLTAMEYNPTNGRYYIFLGNLYANAITECGTTDLEKNAIYKLASHTVLKAIIIEPRLKGTAEELSKSYLQKKITIKTSAKYVKLGCWINQTITL